MERIQLITPLELSTARKNQTYQSCELNLEKGIVVKTHEPIIIK